LAVSAKSGLKNRQIRNPNTCQEGRTPQTVFNEKSAILKAAGLSRIDKRHLLNVARRCFHLAPG